MTDTGLPPPPPPTPPPSPMPDDDGTTRFEYSMSATSGRIRLSVKVGAESFVENLDVTKSDAREKAATAIVAKLTGLDRDDVVQELEAVAAEVAEKLSKKDEGSTADNDAAVLIAIASGDDVELFHTGGRHDGQSYATIQMPDGHAETWRIRSQGFGHWLRGQYYQSYKGAPASDAFSDAINTIDARAMFEGVERAIYLRVAGDDTTVYVDLANDNWDVVKITASGWEIISSSACEVRFIRRPGMLPLPTPVRGGSIEELRQFVNCPTDDLWTLFAGSLPSCFRARGPYAVLVFSGEQGSAKSTTSKRLRDVIDPNKAPVRRLPREERDLMIAAQNGHLLAFDNVSTIPIAISDAMCTIATGGGFGTRQLYSDDDEKLIHVAKPQTVNGIDDTASRPDLLDRAILLHLPTIPEEARREEAEMDKAFEEARPRILGALFDAVSTAIRRLPTTVLTRRPRLIDFAKWCQAAESAFGWEDGTFVDAYMRNRGDAVALAIESSPVGVWVFGFMETRTEWEGTAKELLAELEKIADEATTKRKDWPDKPRVLSDALRRIAPAMRTIGIDIKTGLRKPGGNRERLVVIRKLPTPGGRDEAPGRSETTSSRENGPGSVETRGRDEWDDRDESIATTGAADEKFEREGARDDRDESVAARFAVDDVARDGRDQSVAASFEVRGEPRDDRDEVVAPRLDRGVTEKSLADRVVATTSSHSSHSSRTGPGDPEKADGAGRSGTKRDDDPDRGWSASLLKSCREAALFEGETGADYD